MAQSANHSTRARDDAESLVCTECAGIDEAERAGWTFWSDGLGELLPFCRACAEREFGES